MTKKLFFSVMLAIVLVFGMTVVGCGGDDDSGSGGGTKNAALIGKWWLTPEPNDIVPVPVFEFKANGKMYFSGETDPEFDYSATANKISLLPAGYGLGDANYSISNDPVNGLTMTMTNCTGLFMYKDETPYYKRESGSGPGGPGGNPVSGGGQTRENAFTLTENQWVNSTVAKASSEVWYKFPVSSGKTYYVWWNDEAQGDNSKTGDVVVRAKYGNDTYIFGSASYDDEVDHGWTDPQTFTASQNGTVYLEVRPYNTSSSYTGTFAIVYSTSSTKPGTSSGNPPVGTNPSITIVNNTGVSIPYGYLKQPTATSWSANQLTTSLANGSSREITLPQTLSVNNKYDFILRTATSGGTVFRKYSVTVSNGMTVTFTNADVSDGSELSTIYIRNRIGKNYDGFYYRSSSSSDWGTGISWGSGTGTIPYNSQDNYSLTVSVHPSVSTVFDFQLRTSNPTNTYTKRNLTVTDGMTITFTSADSDTPLTGNPVIVIQNDTGELIVDVWISPVSSSTWGSDLLSINLARGGSYAFTLTEPLSVQDKYDVRICGMFIGQDNYYKRNVTVTEGMILTFTGADHQ